MGEQCICFRNSYTVNPHNTIAVWVCKCSISCVMSLYIYIMKESGWNGKLRGNDMWRWLEFIGITVQYYPNKGIQCVCELHCLYCRWKLVYSKTLLYYLYTSLQLKVMHSQETICQHSWRFVWCGLIVGYWFFHTMPQKKTTSVWVAFCSFVWRRYPLLQLHVPQVWRHYCSLTTPPQTKTETFIKVLKTLCQRTFYS